MLLALLLLTACEPRCRQAQPWEQVPWHLDQPDDADHLAAADRAMAAWDQFAGWSAFERVCVDEVVVGERLDDGEGLGGSYVLPSQTLQLSPTVIDPWQGAFHELCHVVDLQLGHVADDHPDLFVDPDGLLVGSGAYPERKVPGESFARLCEIGARDVQRWKLTNDACGVPFGWHPLTEQPLTDTDLDALALVQDLVFPQASRVPWHAPTFAIEPGPTWEYPAPRDWFVAGVQASADALVLLLEHQEPWRGPAALRLLWLDPHTGAVRHRLDLPSDGLFDATGRSRVALIPGLPAPALRTPAGVWRLAPEGAEPTGRCADADLVVDDVAWTFLDPDAGAAAAACALDPATGLPAASPPPTPGFLLEQEHVGESAGWPVQARTTWAGAAPAVHWQGAGLQWRDAGARWRERALPWHLAVADVVPLRDGRHAALPVWSYDRDLRSLWWTVLLDLDTGALLAPADPCPGDVAWELAGADWLAETWGLGSDTLAVTPARLRLPPPDDGRD